MRPACRLDVLVVAPFPLDVDRGSPLRARRQMDFLRRQGLRTRAIAVRPPAAPLTGEGCRLPLGPLRRPGFAWQKPAFDVELLLRTLRAIRRDRPLVIEAHLHEGLAIALLARLLDRSVRVIYNAHGTLADELAASRIVRAGAAPWRIVRRFESWLERHADAVLAQSEDKRAQLVERGVASVRIHLAPDVPETDLFALERPRSVHSADGEEQEVVCVYTGSMSTYQGIDDLLAAVAHTKGVRYVLFGSPAGHYPATAARLGIADRVTFVDPAPLADLAGVLGSADIAVAARREGGPASVAGKIPAYFAAGLPVIATTAHGVERVVDLAVGVCVRPGDPVSLAAAIQELTEDPARRERLGQRARERAAEAYTEKCLQHLVADAYGLAA